MSDDEVRALERAYAAHGGLAERLRLVRSLGRSGKLVETFHALGLDRVPDDGYASMRALADDLWTEHVRALEPAVRIPGERRVVKLHADPTGSLLAWTESGDGSGGTMARGPVVASGKTGRILHERAARADVLLVARGMVLARSERAPVRQLQVANGSAVPSEVPLAGTLVGLSPDGDCAVIAHTTRGPPTVGVYSWPRQGELLVRPSAYGASVSMDWVAGELLHVWTQDEDRAHVELASLHGGIERAFEVRERSGVRLLGAGVVAETHAGLVLNGKQGWKLEIERRAPTSPSLASDGRSLRVILGGALRRYVIDATRGRLVAASHESHGSVTRDRNALWHPHADIAFTRRRDGRVELRGVDAEQPLLELPPDVIPHAWIEDGEALLVLRDARRPTPEVMIEVWRARA